MGPQLGADPTLLHPRILCLHGGGTNAHIFRLQCRILERHLSAHFRFCYAEAPFPSAPGPDVLSVYKDYGPFKAWLPWRPESPAGYDEAPAVQYDDATAAAGIRNALVGAMAEDDAKGASGPWVGLLGFSQGARVCASLLYMQQLCQTADIDAHVYGGATAWPEFQFGVLLAGRGPLVSLIPHQPVPPGLVGVGAAMMGRPPFHRYSPVELLEVPTIHVHGLLDPGLHHHRLLMEEYFDARQVVLREWEGGHRVPIKTRDVSPLVEEILSMAAVTKFLASAGY